VTWSSVTSIRFLPADRRHFLDDLKNHHALVAMRATLFPARSAIAIVLVGRLLSPLRL
jgi:hypothetical protein